MTAASIVAANSTRRDVAEATHPSDEHCIVECSGHVFAAGLADVQEVLSGRLATPVPQAPPALIGVVEHRGDVLPVVQLSALLGLAPRPYTPAHPILVMSAHNTKVGMLVDRVRHVRSIDRAGIRPAQDAVFRGWYTEATAQVAVLNGAALVARALQTIPTSFQPAVAGSNDFGTRRVS